MDLGIESSADDVIVEWEQAVTPETDEIWRSINGGAYSEIAAVSGSLSSYEDDDGMSSGDVWCYKVRAVSGLVQSGFSNIWCAARNLVFLGSGALSFPTIRLEFGDMGADTPAAVTSLDFSGLKRVRGNLFLDSMTTMASVNLNALQQVDQAVHFTLGNALTSLSLTSLTTIGGDPSTTNVLWNGVTLTPIHVALLCDNCPLLASVSLPNLQFENDKGYLFDSCGLSAASVNHILARARASGVTHCYITLDGGTNAAPSGQGITDKAILLGLGNSVSTN